jgi:ketosteroid isomerase-like protein
MLFIALVVSTNTTVAQEWSAEQKEVWSAIEGWWKLYDSNNVEGVKSLFHKDYIGWTWGDNAPEGQNEAHKWADHMVPKLKIAYTNLKPLKILVIGEVAIAHYYYSTNKTVDGKDVVELGRWTDVWKKEGDKWLLVADSGGVQSVK